MIVTLIFYSPNEDELKLESITNSNVAGAYINYVCQHYNAMGYYYIGIL